MKKLDKILIIGIGNNTRQDDGLGWCFLDLLEANGYNADNLLYKYQLMVEDSDLISNYDTVYFVDADKSELTKEFSFEKLLPSKEVSFSTHTIPPNQVLNLCKTIYAKEPKAYIIKIKGYIWDIEIGLSDKAKLNLVNAFHSFNQKISCN
jgi:hydrogenase maturation protease